ncbi:DEAD/DEAH box helicase family protein [bacterium]|nr:DEAD/DEAH box helicase family protein [bacterium]
MAKILNFRGKWRSYQKRILDGLDFHLMDEKLHIVAAPGAGKTTLGIEVISRINRSTLVLCPTNTIKNQWKDRICSSFLDKKDFGLVSLDIKEPKFITITTYQALLAAFCGSVDVEVEDESVEFDSEDEESDSILTSKRFNQSKADKVINLLKSANVSLLCFDEAHHLRKEWWKALNYLVEELKPKQTVSLTATPPYDVEYSEWDRYEALCGPIDESISIPELVKNGDLCPHQDYIYLSNLRDDEKSLIRKCYSNINELMKKLLNDKELLTYLSKMEFLTPTNFEVEVIFKNPDLFVSIASLLSKSGYKIPKQFLKLFGAKQIELPRFDLTRAKYFLNGFLVTNKDYFPGLECKITEYYNYAKRLGLVQNKRIVLDESSKVQRQIANSLGKLDSILDIVEIEYRNLNKALRMVILADYIKASDDEKNSLGVVPIWRILKDKYKSCLNLGVLCGSLILLPANIIDEFNTLLTEKGISLDSFSMSIFSEDSDFYKIVPKASVKNNIVSLITEMFCKGYLQVLVGTQALLGEGWDAPCINSLILSSTVSSYMLSNQMRGRAIRIDKNNPDKISNIWHLASVRIPKPADMFDLQFFKEALSDTQLNFLAPDFYDLQQLTKRFEGYEAPAYGGTNEITSGIDRVFSFKTFYKNVNQFGDYAITIHNDKIKSLAAKRALVKEWWEKSLVLGYDNAAMTLSVGVDTPEYTVKTLTYTSYLVVLNSILCLAIPILYSLYYTNNKVLFLFGLIVLIIVLLNLLIKFLKTGTIVGVMKQVAIVHLETLEYLGYIKTSLKMVGINVKKSEDGIFVTCKNLSTEENNLLIKCLQEFLNPIENPRYILVKPDTFLGFIKQKDYFSLPSIVSQRKEDVLIFERLWNKYIGNVEIFYTRNLEGRKRLLKARKDAFSDNMRDKSKKISKWQ